MTITIALAAIQVWNAQPVIAENCATPAGRAEIISAQAEPVRQGLEIQGRALEEQGSVSSAAVYIDNQIKQRCVEAGFPVDSPISPVEGEIAFTPVTIETFNIEDVTYPVYRYARCTAGNRYPTECHQDISIPPANAFLQICTAYAEGLEEEQGTAWRTTPTDWDPNDTGEYRRYRGLRFELYARGNSSRRRDIRIRQLSVRYVSSRFTPAERRAMNCVLPAYSEYGQPLPRLGYSNVAQPAPAPRPEPPAPEPVGLGICGLIWFRDQDNVSVWRATRTATVAVGERTSWGAWAESELTLITGQLLEIRMGEQAARCITT